MNTIKTYQAWVESQLDLNKFLGPNPCEIDEDIYYDQLECLPPYFMHNGTFQVGEPYKQEDQTIYAYTFRKVQQKRVPESGKIEYKFFFLGILPLMIK